MTHHWWELKLIFEVFVIAIVVAEEKVSSAFILLFAFLLFAKHFADGNDEQFKYADHGRCRYSHEQSQTSTNIGDESRKGIFFCLVSHFFNWIHCDQNRSDADVFLNKSTSTSHWKVLRDYFWVGFSTRVAFPLVAVLNALRDRFGNLAVIFTVAAYPGSLVKRLKDRYRMMTHHWRMTHHLKFKHVFTSNTCFTQLMWSKKEHCSNRLISALFSGKNGAAQAHLSSTNRTKKSLDWIAGSDLNISFSAYFYIQRCNVHLYSERLLNIWAWFQLCTVYTAVLAEWNFAESVSQLEYCWTWLADSSENSMFAETSDRLSFDIRLCHTI